MPDAIVARGFGYLRPRVMEKAEVSFSDANTDHDLIPAKTGKKAYATLITYSNGGASVSKISLRSGDTTDHFAFYAAANGGGLSMNLLQTEVCVSALSTKVTVRQTAAVASTVFVLYYYAD